MDLPAGARTAPKDGPTSRGKAAAAGRGWLRGLAALALGAALVFAHTASGLAQKTDVPTPRLSPAG